LSLYDVGGIVSGRPLVWVGARSVKESTGRVVRYELIPLGEMGGRPRVDVLCNMSGIFRDSFGNVVGMLVRLHPVFTLS
jgi:magnesium chelatase subunit H